MKKGLFRSLVTFVVASCLSVGFMTVASAEKATDGDFGYDKILSQLIGSVDYAKTNYASFEDQDKSIQSDGRTYNYDFDVRGGFWCEK